MKLNSKGFTLIELMVVIVILGILAGFITVNYIKYLDEAKVAKTKVEIQELETALDLYRVNNGMYPTTAEGLIALVERPANAANWKGSYLKKGRIPKDPWKNDFVYLSPGTRGDYEIISYGRDGNPGGEEFDKDINSWEIE
ncbi:type II secretion system major pseudopilin GspG [Desulfococcaceae bacterium HSG8]|nr:type II secretion system major pseudopilin GspG [Desulfococcaceae bacterium HSG8]